MAGLPLEEVVRGLQAASDEEVSRYVLEILRRFEPMLRSSWRHGGFAVDYEDFRQEVFRRLFEGLPRLRQPRAFPGYLFQIARSVAAGVARRQRGEEQARPIGEEEAEPRADLWVEEEVIDRLVAASYLDRLPAKEAAVVRMSFLEDLDTTEIARRLGIRSGSVRMTRSRALRRLREIAGEEAAALERWARD